jgi:hypothetical protein
MTANSHQLSAPGYQLAATMRWEKADYWKFAAAC